MGVPLYFKTIIETYPHVIQPIQSKIDYLHFDLNCAIHPCCRGLTNENDMFEKIFQKIKDCIELTNVQQKVFIAIDGPAPRAKMEQQRQRRLKSSQEVKDWDTNAITPGTQFMEHLNKFLKTQIKFLSVSCILSDSNEPGEGEHKIMKFIDNTPIHTTHYVYGLDADLIMLSMIRKHPHIYLLRERTEYNFEQTEDEYVSLCISLLKSYLFETIQIPDIQQSKTHLINDYLFLCFLLGNDFIEHLPSVNIRYNGLQNLLFIYQKLQRKYLGQFYLLDDSFKIHLVHLQYFFQELSLSEKKHIEKIQTIRNKQETKMKHIYSYLYKEYQKGNLHTENERWEQFQNQIPMFHRDKEIQIFNKETINKKQYYSYLLYDKDFHPAFEESIKKDIQTLCFDYIRSITWTTHYYFDSCLSWKWYYPYHYTPFVSDISSVLETLSSLDNLIKLDSKPYSPEEQLCIVLPKLSHKLIRNKQYLRESYYYPEKTPLCMFLKRYFWECSPKMPHEICKN